MVFALLIAAIVWNPAPGILGLPASSSSHTPVGSIIGVGIANAMMHGRSGTAGVDWSKATEIGQALLFSPLIGFLLAATSAAGAEGRDQETRRCIAEPKGNQPPPLWIRGLLIATCTSVSFARAAARTTARRAWD